MTTLQESTEIKIQIYLNPKPARFYSKFKPHFLIYKMGIITCIHMIIMMIMLSTISEQAQ